MESLRYLAVEGPVGVGKTSLATMLAKDLNARLTLEEASGNPFLGRFYENPRQYAFQAQIYFLLSRYRQQVELIQQDLFNHTTVSDYLFARDEIFASINLTQDELDLYNKVYQLLGERLPKPDVVIFLQANEDVLMRRIKKRKISYEQGIGQEYVGRVAQAYSQFFFRYTQSPLLVVNTSGIDFVKDKKDYETLRKELYYMWKNRMEKHYVTIDSR